MSIEDQRRTLLDMLAGAALKYYDATQTGDLVYTTSLELRSAAKAYGEHVRKHAQSSIE